MNIYSQSLLTAILLFSSIIIFGQRSAEARWQRQTVETKAGLRGLSVVSDKVIWASGTNGTFLRTVDGGKTWTIGNVPGAEKLDFRDVEAFDANTAYVLSIGRSGVCGERNLFDNAREKRCLFSFRRTGRARFSLNQSRQKLVCR
jgi:photosystem II stability/assembly factor-like uncharacterized protein